MSKTHNYKCVDIVMEQFTENFTIQFTDKGLVIMVNGGNTLEFSACEALMLLDILKEKETELKKMAQEASPLLK